MMTYRALLIILNVQNMLYQLSSSQNNGQSMVMYSWSMSHAPSVATVSCQRSEHRYVFLGYKNMVHQLSPSHDNGQSMVMYYSCMKHAPTIDIVSCQRSGHGYIFLKYVTCSVSCHRLMTTDRAWLFIPKVWNMLCWLSSHDNGLSMFIYPSCMKHAPSVVIVSWKHT